MPKQVTRLAIPFLLLVAILLPPCPDAEAKVSNTAAG